ncbi:hypothetical protein L596_010970 [Steinernema carpocapsae]|uniref:Uncharacterized protein n=1 Tax=Steinernema carpocapsae TaxID=34508 RepID=A0A4V6XWD4_STECR|nr:hypothetical protein L596_010970 [Steinernema carpocapsae]
MCLTYFRSLFLFVSSFQKMTASSKVFLKRGFEADVEYMAAATRENEIERLALLNQLRKMVGGHRFATQLEIMQVNIYDFSI